MTEGLVQADLLDRANVRIGEKAEPASKPEIGGLKWAKGLPDRASGAINPIGVGSGDSKADKAARSLTDLTKAKYSMLGFIPMTKASLL